MNDKSRKSGKSGKSTKVEKNDKSKTAEVEATAGLPAAAAFRDEMDRALGRFFSDDWLSGFPRLAHMWGMPSLFDAGRSGSGSMLAMPRADLSEDDNGYELSVELPGMDEKDLELTLAEGALVIKGEKKEEKEDKERHITERSYGSVQRRFPLPPDVDVEKMDASFAKGVLKVTLPKTGEAQAKGRKIEVRSG